MTRIYADVHVTSNAFHEVEILNKLINGHPMPKRLQETIADRLGVEPAELHKRIHSNEAFSREELTIALGYKNVNKIAILLGMLEGSVGLKEAHHEQTSIDQIINRIGLVPTVDSALWKLTYAEELLIRWRYGLTEMSEEEIHENFFTSRDKIPQHFQILYDALYDPSVLLESKEIVGSLEWIAQQIGLTREWTRQIEAKALRKLRHPHRSKHLQPFIAVPDLY